MLEIFYCLYFKSKHFPVNWTESNSSCIICGCCCYWVSSGQTHSAPLCLATACWKGISAVTFPCPTEAACANSQTFLLFVVCFSVWRVVRKKKAVVCYAECTCGTNAQLNAAAVDRWSSRSIPLFFLPSCSFFFNRMTPLITAISL